MAKAQGSTVNLLVAPTSGNNSSANWWSSASETDTVDRPRSVASNRRALCQVIGDSSPANSRVKLQSQGESIVKAKSFHSFSRKSRSAWFALLCATSLVSEQAWAVYCDGTVSSIAADNYGRVFVAYGSVPIQQICSISTHVGGTTVEGCRSWLAILMSAQAQSRTVRVYYSQQDPNSCSLLQSWGTYQPYFIQTL